MSIGINNQIDDNVKIGNNVIIGNNNIIKSGTIIYDNVIIGDNNIILSNNVIGENPVIMEDYKGIINNGVTIGNNNYFHSKNTIFGGYTNRTIIGDNNKILYDVTIHHDVHIYDNVHLYPHSKILGYTKLLSNCGIGAAACIHQQRVIGSYSFVAMNASITKNVFPFYICIKNNKYSKLNTKRLNSSLEEYKIYLDQLLKNYINNNILIKDIYNKLPDDILSYITMFEDTIVSI